MYKTKLSSFISEYGDGIHGTPIYSDDGEYFFINGNNLEKGIIVIDEDTLKIDYEQFRKISRPLNDRTVLLSINGTLGNTAFYRGENVALGKSACYINIKSEYSKEFFRYILTTKEFQKYMLRVAHGSTIKNFAPSQVGEYEVELPDIEEHENIAKLLSSIDDKICNNNLICDDLEGMAKLLYDYWFVQFDFPDENGKPYKSSGGKMVWNEELKREIPDGWEVSNAIKANVYTSDFTANGSFAGLAENVKYNEGEPYAVLVRIVDYNDNFANSEKFVHVNKHAYDYLKSSRLHGDEIIICNVGNIGLTFRCPHLGMPMTLGPNGIVVNSPEYNDYLFLYYTSSEGQQMLNSISSGSIQKKFNKTDFRNLPFVLPPKLILDKFTKIYQPIKNCRDNLWYENRELASLRDFLLPMLMNGQVKVKKEDDNE